MWLARLAGFRRSGSPPTAGFRAETQALTCCGRIDHRAQPGRGGVQDDALPHQPRGEEFVGCSAKRPLAAPWPPRCRVWHISGLPRCRLRKEQAGVEMEPCCLRTPLPTRAHASPSPTFSVSSKGAGHVVRTDGASRALATRPRTSRTALPRRPGRTSKSAASHAVSLIVRKSILMGSEESLTRRLRNAGEREN